MVKMPPMAVLLQLKEIILLALVVLVAEKVAVTVLLAVLVMVI
jgi:hypothetical protein